MSIEYFFKGLKLFATVQSRNHFFLKFVILTLETLGLIYIAVYECTAPGYTWNPTHLYCYKYHAVGKTCDDASSECRKEDSRSHLFLVDSNNALSFLQNIIGIFETCLFFFSFYTLCIVIPMCKKKMHVTVNVLKNSKNKIFQF